MNDKVWSLIAVFLLVWGFLSLFDWFLTIILPRLFGIYQEWWLWGYAFYLVNLPWSVIGGNQEVVLPLMSFIFVAVGLMYHYKGKDIRTHRQWLRELESRQQETGEKEADSIEISR